MGNFRTQKILSKLYFHFGIIKNIDNNLFDQVYYEIKSLVSLLILILYFSRAVL